ncbi:DUF2804 domain-containing protein [Shewanella sp. 202IG2-18]|uniref:DUF2804 domain-containing protein n=1 Tax=Parashewanella hymeniacidonis TaxID=2807618 RepID=UPI00195FC187|nr:DUF2804 domain-containing protein [Parashewanella hymeniacidonis]MBM7070523.1 DUF2804 domain-containing protein [Parashewanella hymeniacidonis]
MFDFKKHTQIAPEKLIDCHGEPVFGQFDGIVSDLNIRDFNYFNVMDKPMSALKRYFHYKQFQFVSIITPHYIIGVAIADIRYVGSSFCYVYDIHKNKLIETTWLRPLGLRYSVGRSPMNGATEIGSKSNGIRFEIIDGKWHLKIHSKKLSANLRLEPLALSLPMSMCSPTSYSGWTYTQKHNGIKPVGQLTINEEQQPLNHALASYDFSAGFMRRETSWRWASLNAEIEQGVIGLNLAAGVNETGNSENVFWINGERHLLGATQFTFSRHNGAKDGWRILSENGQVDLHFTPRNVRSEKLNLMFLKSNFRQFIGDFNGEIHDNAGITYRLSNVLGLTEDHYAKW